MALERNGKFKITRRFATTEVGNRWHLHLVDLATGWNVSVALPDKKAATVALAIHEHVVLNGPTTCPQKLISDNGSECTKIVAYSCTIR